MLPLASLTMHTTTRSVINSHRNGGGSTNDGNENRNGDAEGRGNGSRSGGGVGAGAASSSMRCDRNSTEDCASGAIIRRRRASRVVGLPRTVARRRGIVQTTTRRPWVKAISRLSWTRTRAGVRNRRPSVIAPLMEDTLPRPCCRPPPRTAVGG